MRPTTTPLVRRNTTDLETLLATNNVKGQGKLVANFPAWFLVGAATPGLFLAAQSLQIDFVTPLQQQAINCRKLSH